MSKIEWTGETWNPTIGCDKVSAGCKNCYAIQTAWIRQHNPKMLEKYAGTVEKSADGKLNWTGKISMHEPSLFNPLNEKRPTVYFVNSMSDIFHENIPFEFIDEIFYVMSLTPQHTFQILTKRSARMVEYFQSKLNRRVMFEWPLPYVWIGVSVESNDVQQRIIDLTQIEAAVKFLSCEPLLGPVTLPIDSNDGASFIDWVICGGESGPGARPMHPDWARSLRDQCALMDVPFFFKQWGEYLPFKETAQAPFYRNCSDLEEYDGHQMDFINSETGDAGKFLGKRWFDTFYSHLMNMENGDRECCFLKTGKKDAGRMLDGKLHNEFPIAQ